MVFAHLDVPNDVLAHDDGVTPLSYKLERRDKLDRQSEQLALLSMLAPVAARLPCFRGIALQGAMVLATEIGDWRRFARPCCERIEQERRHRRRNQRIAR